jgi:hypothetical protein
MRPWESVPAAPPKAGAAGRGGIIQLASAGRGPDRVASGGWILPLDRQIQAIAGLQPALWARPRLTGDAVAVVIVLRIVARLAVPGGGEAHRARRRAVRRCRGMPERHRQRPARKVLDDRVEESGKGKGGERRHADPVPMPAQPGHGRALPSAAPGHPSTLPRHAVMIAAVGLRKA